MNNRGWQGFQNVNPVMGGAPLRVKGSEEQSNKPQCMYGSDKPKTIPNLTKVILKSYIDGKTFLHQFY